MRLLIIGLALLVLLSTCPGILNGNTVDTEECNNVEESATTEDKANPEEKEEESTEAIEEVIVEPKPVILYDKYVVIKTLTAEITAYSPNDPAQGTNGITARGTSALISGCALPKTFRFKDNYFIRLPLEEPVCRKYGLPKSAVLKHDDYGGAITNKKNGSIRIDIRLQSKRKCFWWGRRTMKVELLQKIDSTNK